MDRCPILVCLRKCRAEPGEDLGEGVVFTTCNGKISACPECCAYNLPPYSAPGKKKGRTKKKKKGKGKRKGKGQGKNAKLMSWRQWEGHHIAI
jgi:hypothetical protein